MKLNPPLRFSFFFLLIAYSLQLTAVSRADTITTKEGQEIKGIVVEDYRDRVTFSTADGEITVMKSDIDSLSYDTEADNLVKLAEQAQDRKDFPTAYAYYEKAYKLNPALTRAKDGMVFTQGYVLRKGEVEKAEAVRRQQDLELYGPTISETKSEESQLKENTKRLRETLGLTLEMKDGRATVKDIARNFPAYEAGVRKRDALVAIWGRLVGYMSIGNVLKALLDKPAAEIKCTIERNCKLKVPPGGDIGASFSMEFDGLTVSAVKEKSAAFEAGLKKDDLVVAINGESTRYMPLKKAMELIKKSGRRGPVILTIHREVVFWRG